MAFYVVAGLGALFLMNKKKHREIALPSAPPPQTTRYFSGQIVSGNFYFGPNVLSLSDVRIVNIHVSHADSTKLEDGKVTIMSGERVVFREKLNNGWVSIKRLLLVNATFKIEKKSTKDLVYTIYYE